MDGGAEYSRGVALSLDELQPLVRVALEAGDLDAYQQLLAPDVQWGPAEEPEWGCKNRREVLNWYKAARDCGMGATVNEVVVGTGCLLVGLTVSGTPGAEEHDGAISRWQVLTVRDGQISDIRGFANRDSAAERAGVST